jgi:two-component system, NtrC family, sensor kinase
MSPQDHATVPDRELSPPRLRHVLWWDRLGVKASAVITLVTALGLAVFVVFTLQAQRRYLTAEVVRGAAQFTDTIKASTYHFMLADERENAYRSMETIGRLHGIERVRMLNKDGRVTFSTDRAEIGKFVDKGAEACYACHAAGQPLVRLNVPSRSRIYERNGRRILGLISPIYNEPSCSAAGCHVHPTSKQVLGVVDIAMTLDDEDQAVRALGRRTVALGGLGVVIIALTVGLFVRGYVIKPVSALVVATKRVAGGDFAYRLDIRRTDELGKLGHSFNGMTSSLRQAQTDLQRLNEQLEQQVSDRTAALRDAQAQLVQSEKMSSLGKLAASVAHEINNPLAGILTYAKLLVRLHEEGEMTEAVRERSVRNLRLVQRETERCSAIVRNLLDFARQRPLALKELDVTAVVEEALSLLAHRLLMQGVALEKRLPPMPPVMADFGQLRQAVLNIALNACEAMATGGRLEVTAEARGRAVEILFRDTGPGIAPEHLSRILDPFFTTKEKGTGLGLSVVYGIIERHNGKLDIRSTVGEGTTVVIQLPVSAGAASPAGAGAAETA